VANKIKRKEGKNEQISVTPKESDRWKRTNKAHHDNIKQLRRTVADELGGEVGDEGAAHLVGDGLPVLGEHLGHGGGGRHAHLRVVVREQRPQRVELLLEQRVVELVVLGSLGAREGLQGERVAEESRGLLAHRGVGHR
jgi:hypothetical protein